MPDINALLKKLREEYLGELPTRLDQMESLILQLRRQKSREDLQSLYRDVHSTKGSAGTHGILIITSICHQFEDELGLVSGQDGALDDQRIEGWLAYIDLMRTACDRTAANNNHTEDIERQLHELRKNAHTKTYTCLLVDPAAGSFSKIIHNVLQKHSVNLSYMNDGYQALGRLLVDKFDMLISGMELETMNGVGLITAIKSSKSVNKNIPTILITSGVYERTIRKTDPDYVVKKDVHMPEHIEAVMKEIINKIT